MSKMARAEESEAKLNACKILLKTPEVAQKT
jgi:hypothetical protein